MTYAEMTWMAVALVMIAICVWAMSLIFIVMQQFVIVFALFFEMCALSPL